MGWFTEGMLGVRTGLRSVQDATSCQIHQRFHHGRRQEPHLRSTHLLKFSKHLMRLTET
jgi:hypothetical protein